MKKIAVIDGQGGSLGKEIIIRLLKKNSELEIFGVGTNNKAATTMQKAGAKYIATGERAIINAANECDIIAGPLGIVLAGAIKGEITPKVATYIGKSKAKKILVPVNHCLVKIAGTENIKLSLLLDIAADEIIDEINRKEMPGG